MIAVVTGAELAKVITPWVGVLTHLKGIKSAPQHAIAVERACWEGEAVCAVVARTRAEAEDACELVEVGLRGAARGDRRRDRARSGTPVIQPELGDNLCFERAHTAGDPDKGFKDADAVVETDVRVRPPYRRLQRAARHRRRLESGRAAPHRLPGHAGAAHDAEPVRQAPRPRGAAGARRHQGRRRLVRHQGAHLCGRDGDGGAVEAAQAAGQVRRRPDRELRHRHPRARSSRQGEDRRQERRHHHGVRDRRSHRHRALFGLSAHLRHRGQPDRQPHRLLVRLPELSRPRPRGVPEQERHVPVPRGRPPDRHRGDRRAGRTGGGEDRHRPAGNPAAQSDRRRELSVDRAVGHQVREALAARGARASRHDDELRRPARRAEAAARAEASIAASALRPSSR